MTAAVPGTPSVEHSLLDAYAEAFRRGEGRDPEAWLLPRTSGDSSGVSALRTVGLLIRHEHSLKHLRTPASPDDATGDHAPSAEPKMSAPSARATTGARGAWWDDADWLRTHQLEMLGFLDVDGGGMGVVALAWHSGMKQEVVLKTAREPHFEERFRREIKVHAKLGGHANIAPARTSLIYRNTSVLVVHYVAGTNLRRCVRTAGPLPWPDACRCIRQAALGLMHAHAHGIVHRDVKSSNLVRSDRDGVVSLIDWGLAFDHDAPAHGDESLTCAGGLLGTPEYCAPEQAANSACATAASDLYGLGCTWYELLVGTPPFRGDRPALEHAHARTPVPALPAELDVPEVVEHVLRKVLDKDPDRRYPSAVEFVAALDEALVGQTRPSDTSRRWRTALAPLAAIALVLGAWRFWPVTPHTVVVQDLMVELTDPSAHPARDGKVGTRTFEVREGDQISLHAQLSAPLYTYLISFRPDGQMDLCLPSKDTEPPVATANPSMPPSAGIIDLNDGTGLQVFALVGSRDPLPDFRTWRKQAGPPPWKGSLPASAGVVWRYDGTRIETVADAGQIETTRGSGGKARGVAGALGDVAKWLETRQSVDVVLLKAFGVGPAQR